MMKVIGLTGGIACGKSTVASMLKELGAAIVDADHISRELTRPGGEALPPLREAFGDFVFFPDGTLNRGTLAGLVFQNEKELQKLNEITHPLIREKIHEELEICRKMGALVVILDAPLLFEADIAGLAELVVCVSAPEQVQLDRLQSRSRLNREQALSRISSQWPLAEKEKRSDLVLYTDKAIPALQKEVQELYLNWSTPDA